MPRKSALELIEAAAAAEAAAMGREFLAALLPRAKARVNVAGLIREVQIAVPSPGFYVCRLTGPKTAEVVGEAEIWQRGEYLALLPSLRLVLVDRIGETSDWLCLPYNASDAMQRFRFEGPQRVRLVDGGQTFDRILARVDGGVLWFDDLDRRADPTIADGLRNALTGAVRPAGLGVGEQAAFALKAAHTPAQAAPLARPTGNVTTEERLRGALALSGGTVTGYQVYGDEVMLDWELDGHRQAPMRLTTQGEVISAGICLSGGDGAFDAASVVGVIRDAPAFARTHRTYAAGYTGDRTYDDDLDY